MNPKILLEIILKKWSEMPQPVRVGTYIVFVISYVYLIFAPQYIDGQLKAYDAQTGNSFPLQNQIFEMFVDGRSIRFVTDGRGRYAIPKPSKLPLQPVELSFFPEGMSNGSPEKKVLIPILSAVSGRADILNKDGNYIIDDRTLLTGLSNFFIASAYAQDTPAMQAGQSQNQPAANAEAMDTAIPSGQNKAAVAREVVGMAQELVDEPAIQTTNALDAQGIKNAQLSKLLHQVENRYGVVVNTNRQQVHSIDDIATIVARQKEAKDWKNLTGTSRLKPKSLFGNTPTLQVQDTNLKVQTQAVAEDSAEVVVFREENGEQQLLFKNQILPGESITIEDAGKEYAIELEKVDSTGFDRITNAKAAYLNVKAKQTQ